MMPDVRIFAYGDDSANFRCSVHFVRVLCIRTRMRRFPVLSVFLFCSIVVVLQVRTQY